MGASALALLMLAELVLSILVFGNSIATVLQGYQTLYGQLGLAGQVLFAVFPLMQAGGHIGPDGPGRDIA